MLSIVRSEIVRSSGAFGERREVVAMFGGKREDIYGPGAFEDSSARVRRSFWPTLRRAAGHIPFAEDVVAAYFCALDPATPFRARAVLMAALAYFVLPVDAVPDILAGIGFADDATVLMTALTLLGSHLKPAHREAARRALLKKRPGEVG